MHALIRAKASFRTKREPAMPTPTPAPNLRTIHKTAPANIMAAARANCAARLRATDQAMSALRIETGIDDDCWAMKHELARLIAEQAKLAGAA